MATIFQLVVKSNYKSLLAAKMLLRCLLCMIFTTSFFGTALGQSQKKLTVGGGYFLDFETSPAKLKEFPTPFSEGVIFSNDNGIDVYTTNDYEAVRIDARMFTIRNGNHDTLAANPDFAQNMPKRIYYPAFSGEAFNTNFIIPYRRISPEYKHGLGNVKADKKNKTAVRDTLFSGFAYNNLNYLVFYNGPGTYWYVNYGGNGVIHAFLFEDHQLIKTVVTQLKTRLTTINANGLSNTIVGVEQQAKVLDSLYLHLFDFNRETGVVTFIKKQGIFKDYMDADYLLANGDSIRHSIVKCQLSANDSFAYLIVNENRFYYDSIGSKKRRITTQQIAQVPLFVKGAQPYRVTGLFNDWPSYSYADISLGDDRKIYITGRANSMVKTDTVFSWIGVINYPNKNGPECNAEVLTKIPCREYKVNAAGKPTKTCAYISTYLQKNFLNYEMRILSEAKCDSLYFKATGDANLKEFKFYISDPKGKTDSFFTKEVALEPNVYGKWRIKLGAKTPEGQIIWRFDSIYFSHPPTVTTNADKYDVCGSTDITFTVTLKTDKPIKEKLRITCGNLLDTTYSKPLPKNLQVTLNASDTGKHYFKVNYSDLLCSDFAIDSFYIKPVPVTGFSLSASSGCAPVDFKVTDLSKGDVVEWKYYMQNVLVSAAPSPVISVSQEGIYKIKQVLTSSAGCEAADSAYFTAFAGINPAEELPLLRVTCTENKHVLLEWNALKGATKYEIYKNGNYWSTVTGFSFTDANVEIDKQPYQYAIRAVDACGEKSKENIFSRTILLQGKAVDNDYAELEWSNYIGWAAIVSYEVEVLDANGNRISVAGAGNALNYIDNQFLEAFATEKCYRIKAVEAGGNNQVSYSNTVCLPFMPVIHIPNAFSPNRDDINERWYPVVAGMADYHIKVYSRWGELVWQGNMADNGWDGRKNGSIVPQGEYVYELSFLAANGRQEVRSGTIHLLR